MDRRLKLFYRISIWMILILLLSNAVVKTTIWFSSLPKAEQKDKIIHAIYLFKSTARRRYRYTTELKQKVFNKVDYLLTPAFIMLFALIAVKLVKTPEIFQEQEKK